MRVARTETPVVERHRQRALERLDVAQVAAAVAPPLELRLDPSERLQVLDARLEGEESTKHSGEHVDVTIGASFSHRGHTKYVARKEWWRLPPRVSHTHPRMLYCCARVWLDMSQLADLLQSEDSTIFHISTFCKDKHLSIKKCHKL